MANIHTDESRDQEIKRLRYELKQSRNRHTHMSLALHMAIGDLIDTKFDGPISGPLRDTLISDARNAYVEKAQQWQAGG